MWQGQVALLLFFNTTPAHFYPPIPIGQGFCGILSKYWDNAKLPYLYCEKIGLTVYT